MDDLSPRARALLAAAHGADDPVPADLARVRRGVLLRMGTAGFAATVFSLSLQRAQAFLGVAAPKLVAVVALAVGGSAVYQHAQHRLAAPPPVALTASPSATPSAVAPPAATPVSEPASASDVAPAALEAVPALPVPEPQKRRPRAAVVASGSASALEAEMRWVRAADAALRAGNVSVAQGLLEDHAREFPNGALAEEREGLRIVAGCQGQSAEGKQKAARFLERAPRSLLAGRVRAACPSLGVAELGSTNTER